MITHSLFSVHEFNDYINKNAFNELIFTKEIKSWNVKEKSNGYILIIEWYPHTKIDKTNFISKLERTIK